MKNTTVPSFLTTGPPLVSRSTHRDGAQAAVGSEGGQKKGCSSHPYPRLSGGPPSVPLVTLYTRLGPGKLPQGPSLCHSVCRPALSYSSKHSPCRGPVPALLQGSSRRCAHKWDIRAAERRRSAVDRVFIKRVGFGSRATGDLDPASLFLSSDASADSRAAAGRGPIRRAQRGQRPSRALTPAPGSPRAARAELPSPASPRPISSRRPPRVERALRYPPRTKPADSSPRLLIHYGPHAPPHRPGARPLPPPGTEPSSAAGADPPQRVAGGPRSPPLPPPRSLTRARQAALRMAAATALPSGCTRSTCPHIRSQVCPSSGKPLLLTRNSTPPSRCSSSSEPPPLPAARG